MFDYTTIDFETANSHRGSPCSVGLVRVRDGVAIDERHWLMRPPETVENFSRFNIALHGITPEMVSSAPRWKHMLPAIVDFIGDDVVVAHNAGFDMGVLRHACAIDQIDLPDIRFLCTMVLSRRALALPSYRLPFVVEALGGSAVKHHHALSDAYGVVDIVRGLAASNGSGDLAELADSVGVGIGTMTAIRVTGSVARSRRNEYRLVHSEVDCEPDTDGYLYGRVVVFTGTLMSMTRQIAWDACANVGAIPGRSTNKQTNVLVIGDINPATLRPGSEMTGKARKAFELQEAGQRIEVMTEVDFLRCLDGSPLEQAESLLDRSSRLPLSRSLASFRAPNDAIGAPMNLPAAPYLRPLAVIDEPAGRVCIWHVDVGPDIGLSRLSGAWGVDPENTDTIHTLMKNRHIVRCNGTDIVEREGISTPGTVDVDATVDAVLAERDQLQARFESHAATRKTLVAPTWPDIVHPNDIASTVSRTREIEKRTGDAFPVARGFNELARAWTRIEKQRLARPFLVDPAGSDTRPLPLVLHP